MIKFIIPAIIVFLIVLFWEKICEIIQGRFNVKMNLIVIGMAIIVILIIMILLYF